MRKDRRDLDWLSKRLDRERAWRKKEIADLRGAVQRAELGSDYLFRSALVMLCAHWEGYLKGSLDIYVDFVFSGRPRLSELQPEFVAMSYFSDVQNAARSTYSGSREHHIKLAARIIRGVGASCERPTYSFDTEGNPGTEVVDRLLRSVGLDFKLGYNEAEWAAMKVFIDEQVLRDRHLIAHGHGFKPTQTQVLDRADLMVSLLDRVAETILDAGQRSAFVK